MTGYSIDEFVRDVKAVKAEHGDDREVLQRVQPLAQRLVANKSWVTDDHYRCDEAQGMGISVLHEEPEELLVETVCWMPGRAVLPHDHKTWGVVVGIDGEERNVNWLRKDDGETAGQAKIEAYHEVIIRDGDACALLPDDIHSIHNDGATPSLSLHVYGKSLAITNRNEFDPEADVIRPCPNRVRND